MKWLERLSNNFTRALEAESQTYQAGFGAIGEAMEAVSEAELRPVRSVLGDSPEEFTSEDVVVPRASVLGMNMRNPQEEMPNQRIPKELVNASLDMMLAPSNVLGAGLVTKGVRTVRDAAQDALEYFGPSAGRGGSTASISNYIDNYYGPTGPNPDRPIRSAIGTKTDEGIAAVTGASPENVRAGRQKIMGFFNWGAKSAVDAVEYLIDPQSRALYKEMGITPGSQRHVARALADDAIHKATAQVQYTSHIARQAGRQGPVAEEVKTIMDKSGVTDYFAYTDGAYASAIKEGRLFPTMDGRKASMGAQDLEFIEQHFGNVWKAPDARGADVPFKDAEGTILLIKAPGAGTQTGDHYNDVIKAGGYVGDLYKAFTKYKGKPSLEELWTEMKKVSDSNKKYNDNKKDSEARRWTLSEKSNTLEGLRENGIWLVNTKKGRAYTEGGINYLVKVKPNGNIFAVMSDEHNFLENIAGKGDKIVRQATRREQGASLISQLEKVLPHRLVAVTPPMQANIFRLRSQLGKDAPKIDNVSTGKGAVSRADLEAFASATPSERGMLIEQQRNIGGAEILGGAGMFTLGGDNEEQR